MLAVVKTFFKDYLTSRLFLFILGLELILLLIFTLGINLEFLDASLVSISIMGSEPIYETLSIKNFIEIFTNLIIMVFSFIYIIGASEFYINLIKNPLLNVIITRNVSRTKFIVSKFLGMSLVYILNIILFAFLLSVIIFIKSDFTVFLVSPILASVLFSFKFLVLNLTSALLGALTESYTVSSVIMVLFYFILSPSLYLQKDKLTPLKILYYLVPPFQKLNHDIYALIFYNSSPDLWNLLHAFIIGLIYFTVSIIIFNKKEF